MLTVLITYTIERVVCSSTVQKKWCSVMAAFSMGIVDTIGFKGSLKQHVTFMTGNLQKIAGAQPTLLLLFD